METQKVKALDVVPFRWALWCRIGDGEPFANPIVSAKWLEDGRIGFMLDSHNFLIVEPDAELELIPQDVSKFPASMLSDIDRRHRDFQALRLTPEQLKRKKELLAQRERINAELRLLEVVDDDPLA